MTPRALAMVVAFLAAAAGPTVRAQEEPTPVVIDVVFCLDTTGSMGSVLQAAKNEVRAIVDALRAGEPQPVVRLGVVAYRDRGDAYVTLMEDLTEDVDRVLRFLGKLTAHGGGDFAEDVRSALHVAVTRMSWDPTSERMIYLLGDAPPQERYTDVPSCLDSARAAVARGITITAIQCVFENEKTRDAFQAIGNAGLGGYRYLPPSSQPAGGMSAFGRSISAEVKARAAGASLVYR